ncbi:hypothetical protein QZH41_009628 [Actinostola sp. cb2023]|nr:hypothetical protein QZH41_009628 [Actinostola sp. cb2023]
MAQDSHGKKKLTRLYFVSGLFTLAVVIKWYCAIDFIVVVLFIVVVIKWYDARKMAPNPRRWKTNFRCALNALPDIEEVTEKSCTRGNNAFKVYRMKPMPRTVGFRGPDELILKRINKLKMNENVIYDGEYWLNPRECKPGPYSPCEERGFYYPNQVSHYPNASYCTIPEVEQTVPNDHEIVEIVDQLLFPNHFQIVDQLAQDFDSDLASNSTGSCVTTPDSACVTSPGFSHTEQGMKFFFKYLC